MTSIELHTSEIPGLITWFNSFVGYREIQKRIERVEAKLREVGFISPMLSRRYYFHSAYKTLVVRNRTFQRINVSDFQINRALSCIAAIRELSKLLSDAGKDRFRSRIIASLSPDCDIRELEHELRAFVHYRQAGLVVLPADGEGNQRFDFLVKGPNGEFELECKTFMENIGNAISIDDSMHVFRGFRTAFERTSSFQENGIITLTFPGRATMSEIEITSAVSNFLVSAPRQRAYANCSIEFARKRNWEELLSAQNMDGIIQEVVERYEATNTHFMMVLSKTRAVMFCVSSNRRPRPLRAIFDRLKSASEQFTRSRPAVIWGHFLAPGEEDFRDIIEKRRLGFRVFDVFGHYLFKSPNRAHLCRLRLSVDGELVRRVSSQPPHSSRAAMTTGGGPAYDLISNVSKFDPHSTR